MMTVALTVLSGASLAVPPTITNLGVLQGMTASEPAGVSGDGTVVAGTSSVPGQSSRAFRWTVAGGLEDLGLLSGQSSAGATAISDDGNTVAGVTSGLFVPTSQFRWAAPGSGAGGAGQGMLPLLLTGPITGNPIAPFRPLGVSGDGAMVVGYGSSLNGRIGIIWNFGGQTTGLGTDPGGWFISTEARAVTPDGAVIVGFGFPDNNSSLSRPFRWTAAAGFVNVQPGDNQPSSAVAVTDDGGILVGSRGSSPLEAVRWTSAGRQSLGSLPGYRSYSAEDISGDGRVIVGGASTSLNERTAFVWTEHTGMVNLLPHLATLGTDTTGWSVLRPPIAVNRDGTVIVGVGVFQGTTRAFRITGFPASRPCAADVNADGLVSVQDIFDFLGFYFTDDARADLDGSGSVSVQDIFDFLAAYFTGCA